MKTQIDLSSIVVAPEYRQKITIIRDKGGEWYQGSYQKITETIITMGVISGTDERVTDMIPEGDRISEEKYIHTIIPIYTTRSFKVKSGDIQSFDADIVIWNGEKYKVTKVQDSGDYGYWRGVISKIGTADVQPEVEETLYDQP